MLRFSHDLLTDILHRLPVETLLRFKCLSHSICLLIDDPDFIKRHLNQSIKTNSNRSLILSYFLNLNRTPWILQANLDSLEYFEILDHPINDCENSTTVIGSCNGLIAIDNHYGRLALWNPSTKKHQMLPSTWVHGNFPCNCRYNCGFGFDDSSDDYKLVRMRVFIDSEKTQIDVYSLKANSWSTQFKSLPYRFCQDRGGIGAFFNHALHWSSMNKLIVGFDLTNEMFYEVPLPDIPLSGEMFVAVLRGCLCMYVDCDAAAGEEDNGRIDVWVMEEYKVKESWTKLFSFSRDRNYLWEIKEHTKVKPSWTRRFLVSIDEENKCVMKGYAVDESWSRLLTVPATGGDIRLAASHVVILAYSETGNKVLLLLQDGKFGPISELCWLDLDEHRVETIRIHDMNEMCNYGVGVICVSSLVSLPNNVM